MRDSRLKPPSSPLTCLLTSQTVEIQVPREALPIEAYLSHPDRLVRTLAPQDRLALLQEGLYRLTILPVRVLNLTIAPIVDVKVWLDDDRKVQVESIACEISGLEAFRDRFDLKLVGELYPIHTPKQILLRGSALLRVNVDLPMPFSMMPRSMVESAGNGVLDTTLKTVKGRMLKYIIKDYQAWVREQTSLIKQV